ncbi:hypothetical protein CP532_3416 [Ophiocordyceps camponoti-leonardi (nom. inval.)]|nr:hypothetical protein CP532_3416 [Ophiocordyceps camponoti-leonardi (nom. inval.)]
MSDSERSAPKVAAADVLAMDDEQLQQFILIHRDHDGYMHLLVDRWETISPPERDRLAERFRAQQTILAETKPTRDFPPNSYQLDARLQQLSDGGVEDRLRMLQRTTARYTEEEEVRHMMDAETKAYKKLVKDGGRLPFPIIMIEEVVRNTEQYHDMLWPFMGAHPRDSKASRSVFQVQLKRWQNFRKWQLDNRGLKEEDNDDDFSSYLEKIKRLYTKNECTYELAGLETDPSKEMAIWLDLQRMRDHQKQHHREPGCETLSQYAEAIERRLARHGVTQQFDLHEDPKQQDRLTTWVEYLSFEYWWLDRYACIVEEMKWDHDRRWRELGDEGLVKPYETSETIRTPVSAKRRAREEKEAADAADILWQKANSSGQFDETRHPLFCLERQMWNRADERRNNIRRDNNMITWFIEGTARYEKAKKDALYQAAFTQWVLQQVHKAWLELGRPEMIEDISDSEDRKRKRSPDEDEPEQGSSKRRGSSHGEASAIRDEVNQPKTIKASSGTKKSGKRKRDEGQPEAGSSKKRRTSNEDEAPSARRLGDSLTSSPGRRRSVRFAA